MLPPPARRPLLLGHRGARRCAPENTLAAFALALEHGCDGFEFDVRLSADSQAVICHDAKLGGLTIADTRLEDLCAGAARHGLELCCLPDVLRRFASHAILDIELKVRGLESAAIAALRQWRPSHGYFVSSFLPEVLKRVHAADDSVPLGLICDKQRQLAQWNQLPIEAVFLERKLVSRGLIEELQAAGKQVFVWTVNAASEMHAFAEVGVEGIISDDTELLARTFPFSSRLV